MLPIKALKQRILNTRLAFAFKFPAKVQPHRIVYVFFLTIDLDLVFPCLRNSLTYSLIILNFDSPSVYSSSNE